MTATQDLDLDTPAWVLEQARSLRSVADSAEAELLMTAAQWAAMHSGDSVVTEHDWQGSSIPLAGVGAPEIEEFCVAEFALAVGLSTDAGRRYLGEAIEVRYRLPRVADRVAATELPAWRARRIAAATLSLSAEAAAFVDRHVAPVAHRVGLAQLDRLVEEARVRFDPEQAELVAAEAAECRHATVHTGHVGSEGTVDVTAVLDLADAVDLEHALRTGAAALAASGSTDSLAARRARALGLLARGQVALPTEAAASPSRRILLHVHLSAAAVASSEMSSEVPPVLARVEESHGFVLIDQVASWCSDPATQVDVLPVIDLADHVSVAAYEVPDRLKLQVGLRDVVCVFPHCTRKARRCDHDHRVPHDQGGATCTCNLAPLCRGHHRLKTHGGWRYTALEPGSYLWSSPHGYTYLRDQHGTLDVTPRRGPRGTGCTDPPPDDG